MVSFQGFKSKQRLDQHNRQKHGITEWYCHHCERYFTSEAELDDHTLKKHAILWDCDLCDRSFKSETGLDSHRQQKHGVTEWRCSLCDRYLKSEGGLDAHRRTKHGIGDWQCLLCDRYCSTENGLEDHLQQKHGITNWYCAPCSRYFATENSLSDHERTHKIRSCPGKKCTKKFTTYADLAQHLESGACRSGVDRAVINRTAVKMDRNNVITNPGRLLGWLDSFVSAPTIMQSYATELSYNGSAYECMLCRSEFKTLARLNQHLSSPVHDEEIYRCPKRFGGCETEFKTLSALMQHAESGRCEIRKHQTTVNRALDDITAGIRRIGF